MIELIEFTKINLKNKGSKMKLFIQIPCLNEEVTLPSVVTSLPHTIEGIDEIYTLVIDDGSTDKTVEVAKSLGVDYIIKNNCNLGLATSFCKGVDASLSLGADIIVNIDGDNQYKADKITNLVQVILEKRADIVVGCRDLNHDRDFGFLKKVLQRVGSKVVCRLSGIDVPDTTSGFRAFNRMTARKIVIKSIFSYTLEMLCQARRIGLRVGWVPIEINPKTRESRLFKSNFEYVFQQAKIIIMVLLEYYPLAFFSYFAFFMFIVSMLTGLGKTLFLSCFASEKFYLDSLPLLFLSASCLLVIAGLIGSVLSNLHLLLIDIRNRTRIISNKSETIFEDYDVIVSPKFFKWMKASG